MSRVKRPRIEVSVIVESGDNEAGADNSDSVTEVSSKTGFDSLPDEMVLKVFSYLDHGDKLCSRLVNKHWNHLMTSWPEFKKSVVYVLKKEKRALETLSKFGGCLSNVRIEEFKLDLNHVDDFHLLDGVADTVTSLEITWCNYDWVALKRIIAMFSNLESLAIVDSEHEIEDDDVIPVTRDEELVPERWAKVVKKLRNLKLELAPLDIKTIFPEFKGLNNLDALDLKLYESEREGVDTIDDLEEDDFKALEEELFQIISKSSKTLKILKMVMCVDDNTQRVLTSLMERIIHLVNLTEFDIRVDEVTEYDEDYLNTLQHFVSYQKKLLHVTLPRADEDQFENLKAIGAKLPHTLRSLEGLMENFLVPGFLDTFTDLAKLESFGEIHQCLTTGKKYQAMRYLKCEIAPRSLPNWLSVFPNLTTLIVYDEEQEQRFGDEALQTIIKHLKTLSHLELVVRTNITDYGVTGIQKEHCRLLSEKGSFKDDAMEIAHQERTGLPLCSLTELKTLSIQSYIGISDVGIRFGFCFKKLRYLTMTVGERDPQGSEGAGITDWGLKYLGKLNPNVEYMALGLLSRKAESPSGIEGLKKQLGRIKSHNFEYEIGPPVSSDDEELLQ